MDLQGFGALVLDNLPFEPNDQQIQLVAALSRYCSAYTAGQDRVFILNGYAGTGKTSVMGALVRSLRTVAMPTVLLASTGRAAKVLSSFTGQPAFTIHRYIYNAPAVTPDGRVYASVKHNPHRNTVFIVDEASMIGDDESPSRSSLLQDLLLYVFSGVNCRLILVGDTAQLPPVGFDESPAMTPEAFKRMGMSVTRATMTRTARQQARSGILYNATALRRGMLEVPLKVPSLRVKGFDDVSVVEPEGLQEALEDALDEYGADQVLLITRSNRRAVDFNLAIRGIIYGHEEILAPGERLMVAKNNYYWTRGHQQVDFIANGEVAVVERIYGTEEREGCLFADVELNLPEKGVTLDAKLALDTLTSDQAALGREKLHALATRALYDDGRLDASATAQRDTLRKDPYYNALQVKYAYAVTCHKAQGGQWASVFVDMGYIPPEAYQTLDLYRWLYTAVTRATTRLTLINPTIPVLGAMADAISDNVEMRDSVWR